MQDELLRQLMIQFLTQQMVQPQFRDAPIQHDTAPPAPPSLLNNALGSDMGGGGILSGLLRESLVSPL